MNKRIECAHCGLGRETILATEHNCLKGKEHEFGDHGISFPEDLKQCSKCHTMKNIEEGNICTRCIEPNTTQSWEERFNNKFCNYIPGSPGRHIFKGSEVTPVAIKIFISSELSALKAEVKSEVGKRMEKYKQKACAIADEPFYDEVNMTRHIENPLVRSIVTAHMDTVRELRDITNLPILNETR